MPVGLLQEVAREPVSLAFSANPLVNSGNKPQFQTVNFKDGVGNEFAELGLKIDLKQIGKDVRGKVRYIREHKQITQLRYLLNEQSY